MAISGYNTTTTISLNYSASSTEVEKSYVTNFSDTKQTLDAALTSTKTITLKTKPALKVLKSGTDYILYIYLYVTKVVSNNGSSASLISFSDHYFSNSSYSTISADNWPTGTATYYMSGSGKTWENISTSDNAVFIYKSYVDASTTSPNRKLTSSRTIDINLTAKDTSSNTTSVVYHRLNITVTLPGMAPKYKAEFDGDGGTVTGTNPIWLYPGDTLYLSAYKASKSNKALSDTYYIVTFNANGGSFSDGSTAKTNETSHIKNTRSYTFNGWKKNGSGAPTLSAYTMTAANVNFVASYDYKDTPSGTTTLSLITDKPGRKGYIYRNWSYSSSQNMQVNSGEVINNNVTVYAYYEPVSYTVKFNLNGGSDNVYELVDDNYVQAKKIPDNQKTYDSTIQLPITTYYRLGYTFQGWGYPNTNIASESTVGIQGPGAWMDDRVYNAISTGPNDIKNPVTLYGQWSYKNNTVNFKYFTSSDSSLTTKVETYNRSIDTYTYGAPVDGQWGGDYVFLGWVVLNQEQLAKWTQKKGVYNNELEIINDGIDPSAIVYPYVVKTAALKTLDEWGTEYTYYGIWTKTGKYIKVADLWRKVNTVYIKIDGRWRPVIDMYYKVDNTWQTELGIPE